MSYMCMHFSRINVELFVVFFFVVNVTVFRVSVA